MQAAFGRGTLYTAEGNHLLADVYYFIQPKACLSGADDQMQGFIDPILEYTPLSKILRRSQQFVMKLDDGRRVTITLDKGHDLSNQIPLFFSIRDVAEEIFESIGKAGPVRKPEAGRLDRSYASPGIP